MEQKVKVFVLCKAIGVSVYRRIPLRAFPVGIDQVELERGGVFLMQSLRADAGQLVSVAKPLILTQPRRGDRKTASFATVLHAPRRTQTHENIRVSP
ncbi:MAG: hypothetical protein H6Q04_2785 [Acidobacteria bacterium]|jgi:hypothetical protein|nr:hypothetical protein [Acidobacteriota bacterium]